MTKGKAIGPILAMNLFRLGYADLVVRASEVAKLVEQNTGKRMSRQRISNMMNSVNVRQETIENLAMALGVEPSELTKG